MINLCTDDVVVLVKRFNSLSTMAPIAFSNIQITHRFAQFGVN